MQRRRDDPRNPECDGSRENRNRDIALLDNLFPEIEGRRLRQNRERRREHSHAEHGEQQAVEQRNAGHRSEFDGDISGTLRATAA